MMLPSTCAWSVHLAGITNGMHHMSLLEVSARTVGRLSRNMVREFHFNIHVHHAHGCTMPMSTPYPGTPLPWPGPYASRKYCTRQICTNSNWTAVIFDGLPSSSPGWTAGVHTCRGPTPSSHHLLQLAKSFSEDHRSAIAGAASFTAGCLLAIFVCRRPMSPSWRLSKQLEKTTSHSPFLTSATGTSSPSAVTVSKAAIGEPC